MSLRDRNSEGVRGVQSPPAVSAETEPQLLFQQELLISPHGASRPLRITGSWAAAGQGLGGEVYILLPTLSQDSECSLQYQREKKNPLTEGGA